MMTNHSKPFGSIKTTWEMCTYDVWGNARDGYDVNDSFSAGEIELRIPQTQHNLKDGQPTPQTFISAYPSDRQIKRAFGVNCRIDTNGDDMRIDVTRQRDGYPIGEMVCTSHTSLSPVRKA